MTKLEQAARQALDALEHLQTWPMAKEAITALREALAEQAEQEPVAWMWKPSKPFPQYTVITDNKEHLEAAKEQGVEITPLYAAPVQQAEQERMPITEPVVPWLSHKVTEQAEQEPVGIVWDASASVVMDSAAPKNENQEVAELRKKVAALKAVVDAWNNVEHEPIGYIDAADLRELCNGNERQYSLFTEDKGRMVAIYAAPVRTKDLTDAELNNLWIGSTKGGWIGLFRTVIAADRERNK